MLIQALETLDVAPYLNQIQVPTLVVGFAFDLICPPEQVSALAGEIPGARYQQLPAGHAGPWEATDLMNQALGAFLT